MPEILLENMVIVIAKIGTSESPSAEVMMQIKCEINDANLSSLHSDERMLIHHEQGIITSSVTSSFQVYYHTGRGT